VDRNRILKTGEEVIELMRGQGVNLFFKSYFLSCPSYIKTLHFGFKKPFCWVCRGDNYVVLHIVDPREKYSICTYCMKKLEEKKMLESIFLETITSKNKA
jgi:hypothetical protein